MAVPKAVIALKVVKQETSFKLGASALLVSGPTIVIYP